MEAEDPRRPYSVTAAGDVALPAQHKTLYTLPGLNISTTLA